MVATCHSTSVKCLLVSLSAPCAEALWHSLHRCAHDCFQTSQWMRLQSPRTYTASPTSMQAVRIEKQRACCLAFNTWNIMVHHGTPTNYHIINTFRTHFCWDSVCKRKPWIFQIQEFHPKLSKDQGNLMEQCAKPEYCNSVCAKYQT